MISSSPTSDEMHAGADRVGAERRPDDPLLEIGQGRRQRAGPQRQRQVSGDLSGREASADAALIGDASFEPRRRHHAVVEHDRQIAGRCSRPRALPNLRAPSDFSSKWTAGWLFSSSPGLALRRSCPVTGATLRTT